MERVFCMRGCMIMYFCVFVDFESNPLGRLCLLSYNRCTYVYVCVRVHSRPRIDISKHRHPHTNMPPLPHTKQGKRLWRVYISTFVCNCEYLTRPDWQGTFTKRYSDMLGCRGLAHKTCNNSSKSMARRVTLIKVDGSWTKRPCLRTPPLDQTWLNHSSVQRSCTQGASHSSCADGSWIERPCLRGLTLQPKSSVLWDAQP